MNCSCFLRNIILDLKSRSPTTTLHLTIVKSIMWSAKRKETIVEEVRSYFVLPVTSFSTFDKIKRRYRRRIPDQLEFNYHLFFEVFLETTPLEVQRPSDKVTVRCKIVSFTFATFLCPSPAPVDRRTEKVKALPSPVLCT